MRGHPKAPYGATTKGIASRAVTTLAIALLVTLVLSPSAFAEKNHVFTSAFGEPCLAAPCGNSQFSLAEHSGLAVNETSGDVYVADTNDERIEQFQANGTFVRSFAAGEAPTFIAIDNSSGASAGDVYVGSPLTNKVSKFDSSGNLVTGWGTGGSIDGSTTTLGAFQELAGVAVDGAGVLHVYGAGHMFEFQQTGAFIKEFGTAFGTSQVGIALDSTGAFYKARGSGVVAKFTPTGDLAIEEIPCGCAGIAVDRSNDNLYAAQGSEVHRFDPSANPREVFGPGDLNTATGVAVNAKSSTVYVADSATSQVDIFGPVLVPDSTTEAATKVRRTTATLNGAAGAAGGPQATCVFQYATESDFAQKEFTEAAEAPCAPAGPFTGSSSAPVSAAISGLEQATVYRFRLFASSANGSNPGRTLSFETPGPVNVQAAAASNVSATTTTVNATINPEGTAVDSCVFEYGEDESYGQSVPCAESGGDIGTGEDPVSVHAGLTGLNPGAGYHFRLAATNTRGTSNTTDGFLQTVGLPAVSTLLAFDRSPEGAELRGELNPNLGTSALSTTYRFEYGTDTSYGHSSLATSVTSAFAGPYATATLSDLTPATTYHYRLVAENVAGLATPGRDRTFITPVASPPAETCPNAARRTEDSSTTLPDCRAYELVSPPGNGKEGGDVFTDNARTHAAVDGSAAAFAAYRSFGDSAGTGQTSEFLSERSTSPSPGNNGWSTHSISPHQRPSNLVSGGQGLEPLYVGELSADLSKGVFSALSPLTEEPLVAEAQNLYTRTDLKTPGAGTYLLDTACPLCAQSGPLPSRETDGSSKPQFVGASADFSHVLFESSRQLTAESTADPNSDTRNVFQSINGEVSLVSLIPPPGQAECGASGPACVPAANAVAGRGRSFFPFHVISADGSRISFTVNSPLNSGFGARGALYQRVDNQSTVQINASEKTNGSGPGGSDPAGPQPATYQEASVDGSRVFFYTTEQLVNEDEDSANDLYMWSATPDSEGHHLTRIHALGEGRSGGVMGVSADGHYVYFVGQEKIYLWHDGDLSLIGPSSSVDASPNFGQETFDHESRVSPDGQSLLFVSHSGSGLSGYDNSHVCTENGGAAECQMLYLYTAGDDQLHCVSCYPDGSPANQNAFLRVRVNEGPTSTSYHLPLALSGNGRFVFFSTKAALVNDDTNGKSDAYEYDATTEELHLLSSGTSPDNSYFMDASDDGHDAFIVTAQRLLGWDVDGNDDLYDARVGGGFAEPPLVISPCSGETCRQGSPVTPAAPSAGSASFSGPGNPKPQRHKRKAKKQKHVKRHAHRHHGGSK